MIIDKQLLFSDGQTVSADGDSTNVIDRGKGAGRNMNPRLRVFAQVTGAPTGMTAIVADLKGCATNSATAGDWKTVATSGSVTTIAKGTQLFKDVPYLTDEKFRFYKIVYDVSGTVSAGAVITAGLIADGVDVTELTH